MSGIDYQNRVGHKTGSGAPATAAEWNLERKERLRRLALETIDLNKDPYFMKNHLGHFECRMCLTLHVNEGSYLAHTQGRKHQTNLARRKEKEKAESGVIPAPAKVTPTRTGTTVKIGRPGYRVSKLRDPDTLQKALLFEIDYPEINEKARPFHRFMSAFEQRVETPPDAKYQFLLFAAEPYETIGFKIPNMEVDRTEGKFHSSWDSEKKVYMLQLFFLAYSWGVQAEECARGAFVRRRHACIIGSIEAHDEASAGTAAASHVLSPSNRSLVIAMPEVNAASLWLLSLKESVILAVCRTGDPHSNTVDMMQQLPLKVAFWRIPFDAPLLRT